MLQVRGIKNNIRRNLDNRYITIELQIREIKLEMCQDDTEAPAQGHPHPHADILQKIKLRECDP